MVKLDGPVAKILQFSDKDKGIPQSFSNVNRNIGNTPFIHQTHINLCGDACLNMLLATHGKPHDDKLSRNPRGAFEGLDSGKIIQGLKDGGLSVSLPTIKPENNRWNERDLAAELEKNGPAICGLKTFAGASGHVAVLLGVKDETVLYHDPWKGPNKSMKLSDLNRHIDWEDPYSMIFAKNPDSRNSTSMG